MAKFRKAERRKSKLRLGIAGPSGSGKTYSSLLIAYGITGDWEKIAVIDTENGSADLYADLGDYAVCTLEPPYTPEKYIETIKEAEREGFEVIIIDSLTHAWSGEGGILDQHGKATDSKYRGNSWSAWREFTPKHNKLVETMLQSKCHIIATLRSKTEYIQTKEGDKTVIKKVGMAPIQREGMEYEFTVFFDISLDHIATPSKDRTNMFDGQYFKPDIETGKKLKQWLDSGVEPPKPDYKQLYIAGKSKGLTEDDVKLLLASKYQVSSSKDLTFEQFNEALQGIKNTPAEKLKKAVENIRAKEGKKGA